jgi:hypothetical protein
MAEACEYKIYLIAQLQRCWPLRVSTDGCFAELKAKQITSGQDHR